MTIRAQWKRLYGKMRAKHINIMDGRRARPDKMRERADIALIVKTYAKDGVVGLVTGGTDCDGYRWEHFSTIPAYLTAYLGALRSLERSADGPCYCYMVPPDSVVED